MITGIYISYYLHCPRHLWLFAKNINWENTSEDVKIGKLISEFSYERAKHEVYIGDKENQILVDFIDRKRKIIHEVKKSKRMEELHIWQVKYYLYVLDKNGIKGFTGEINYPREKRLLKVILTEEDKTKIDEAIKNITQILKLSIPPSVINKPYCKKCSYYEFCYV